MTPMQSGQEQHFAKITVIFFSFADQILHLETLTMWQRIKNILNIILSKLQLY